MNEQVGYYLTRGGAHLCDARAHAAGAQRLPTRLPQSSASTGLTPGASNRRRARRGSHTTVADGEREGATLFEATGRRGAVCPRIEASDIKQSDIEQDGSDGEKADAATNAEGEVDDAPAVEQEEGEAGELCAGTSAGEAVRREGRERGADGELVIGR
jgi:hypothetical protein